MRASDRRYFRPGPLYRLLAVSSLALLAATVWMLAADACREWPAHQQAYREAVERRAAWEDREPPRPSAAGIDQILLPELTLDLGMQRVARMDRCTTCHQGIGAGNEPVGETLLLWLAWEDDVLPADEAAAAAQKGKEPGEGEMGASPEARWGLALGDTDLWGRPAATVRSVAPESPAAAAREFSGEVARPIDGARLLVEISAGNPLLTGLGRTRSLAAGDVIEAIDGQPVATAEDVRERLSAAAAAGRAALLRVRRGLPTPLAGHPRIDLMVGPESPHPAAEFGCTICHDGQPGATAFRHAAHQPNCSTDETAWRDSHGWSAERDWPFPMLPRRFVESRCLACHHQPLELADSDRFGGPPAPKLVAGYETVLRLGCYGCHPIQGYDAERRPIGPDLRLEPLPAASDDDAPPGDLPRVGPSLRRIADKLDAATLQRWIADPAAVRPGTRMPQVFGLHAQLDLVGAEAARVEAWEAAEAAAIAAWLLDASAAQASERGGTKEAAPVFDEPGGQTPGAADAASPHTMPLDGRQWFQRAGCVACHRHGELPQYASDVGPELTGLERSLGNSQGRRWLIAYLLDPAAHDPHGAMPNVRLPSAAEAEGIADFLLPARGPDGRAKAEAVPPAAPHAGQTAAARLPEYGNLPEQRAAVEQLVRLNLAQLLGEEETAALLAAGTVPAGRFPPHAAENSLEGEWTWEKKLLYLGRKSIAFRGCYGCHEIPGFESAAPIGPELTRWGRVDPARLDFGGAAAAARDRVPSANRSTSASERSATMPADEAFFLRHLERRTRIGFLAQKLAAPRSFDFGREAERGYLQRLRMPQFSLTGDEREAVMTFILGLVGDPPPARYVPRADERRRALAVGRRLDLRYGCTACHMLSAPQWEVARRADDFPPPVPVAPWPLPPQAAPRSLPPSPPRAAAGRTVTLTGLPTLDPSTGAPLLLDEEEYPVEPDEAYDPRRLRLAITLWEEVEIDGQRHRPGGAPLVVRADAIERFVAAEGGTIARRLLPLAVELAAAEVPTADANQAWGWLPPPLVGQGRKTQPAWLHGYLLDPQPIRPASILMMPRYPLRPAEAAALVAWFAARDEGPYPFEAQPRSHPDRIAALQAEYAARFASLPEEIRNRLTGDRLADAMRMVAEQGYCAQCHVVGEVTPGGSPFAHAPDLAAVERRLRGGYVLRWLAEPAAILPYTPMPVNIPYLPGAPHEGGMPQEVFPGTAREQLEALTDLMMNFDRAARRAAPNSKEE